MYRNANGDNNAKNVRIHIATYQTLGVDTDLEGHGVAVSEQNFLTENYPLDFFSHIIIDESHRSAWGKWNQVLTRNPNAVQVGLTATPRQIKELNTTPEDQRSQRIISSILVSLFMNTRWRKGYLAACEVIQRDIFLDKKQQSEQETGVQRDPRCHDGQAVEYCGCSATQV